MRYHVLDHLVFIPEIVYADVARRPHGVIRRPELTHHTASSECHGVHGVNGFRPVILDRFRGNDTFAAGYTRQMIIAITWRTWHDTALSKRQDRRERRGTGNRCQYPTDVRDV